MRKLWILLMLIPFLGHAQDSLICQGVGNPYTKVHTKCNMLSIGHTSLLDTYLSQEHYSGIELGWITESTKRNYSSKMISTWTSQIHLSETEPRSENANELSAWAQESFAMHYPIYTSSHFEVALGGQAEAFIGGTYNTRNGNNPAQLYAGIDIAPAARIDYAFELWNRLYWLRYSVSAPLAGMQFSPAFGQSYYEIFSQGNYDHNVCITSPFNATSVSNRLTLNIPLRKATLVVGYLGDFRQAELNGIKHHAFTHSLLIGWQLWQGK